MLSLGRVLPSSAGVSVDVTEEFQRESGETVDAVKPTGQTKRVGHTGIDRELKVICTSLGRCSEATHRAWVGLEVEIVLKAMNRLSRYAAQLVDDIHACHVDCSAKKTALETVTAERDSLRAENTMLKQTLSRASDPRLIQQTLDEYRLLERASYQAELYKSHTSFKEISSEVSAQCAERSERAEGAAVAAGVCGALLCVVARFDALLCGRQKDIASSRASHGSGAAWYGGAKGIAQRLAQDTVSNPFVEEGRMQLPSFFEDYLTETTQQPEIITPLSPQLWKTFNTSADTIVSLSSDSLSRSTAALNTISALRPGGHQPSIAASITRPSFAPSLLDTGSRLSKVGKIPKKRGGGSRALSTTEPLSTALTATDVQSYGSFLNGSDAYQRFFEANILAPFEASQRSMSQMRGHTPSVSELSTTGDLAMRTGRTSATIVFVKGESRTVKTICQKRTFWGCLMHAFQNLKGRFSLIVLSRSLMNKSLSAITEQSVTYHVQGLHKELTRSSKNLVLKVRDVWYSSERQEQLNDLHKEKETSILASHQEYHQRALDRHVLEQTRVLRYKIVASELDHTVAAVQRRIATLHESFDAPLERRYRQQGILYMMASMHGRQAWRNPYYDGKVGCRVSSAAPTPSTISALVAKHVENNELSVPYFCTADVPMQWVEVDVGPCVVIPQAYSFASHHPIAAGSFPRSWTLEGSVDREEWAVLARHTDDKSFSKHSPYAVWTLPHGVSCEETVLRAVGGVTYYRYFRVGATGVNSCGTHEFQIACFEIYGRVLCLDSEYIEGQEHTPAPLKERCPPSTEGMAPLPPEPEAEKKTKNMKKTRR